MGITPCKAVKLAGHEYSTGACAGVKLPAGEEALDGGDERSGIGRWAEAGDDVAAAVGEELGEVPFDAVDSDEAEDAGLLTAEELVERMGAGAVDIDLGEDGKGDAVIFAAEVADLFGGTGLLVAELVGGEAEDIEAAVFIGAIEEFEAGVLRREAALAGGIDDEQDAAAESVERNFCAVEEPRGEAV